MKIEGGDRTSFDQALRDPKTTILVFAGQGTTAAAVHDCAERNKSEPWHRVFWFPDHAPLSEDERKRWSLGDPPAPGAPPPPDSAARFAVLSKHPKSAVTSGGVTDLLRPDGQPSDASVQDQFDLGDEA